MTGNPGLDKAILGINTLVTLAAAAMVFYAHNMIAPPPTNRAGEFGDMIEKTMAEYKSAPIVLKEMIVNLYSRETRLRYLNTKMHVDIFKSEDEEMVRGLKPIILDIMIDITGNTSPRELNSITGKILLESRIKTKFNEFMGRPTIKKIYFTKFIVQ